MKFKLYRTARALISCQHFQAGDVVSVRYSHMCDGTVWYMIDRTEHGALPSEVAYPEHHLTNFVL